jgi:hypothetical protein
MAMVLLSLAASVASIAHAADATAGKKQSAPQKNASAKPAVAEARARAELLHDAMHATLITVHHEYYREDEGLTIPAVTLKNVFQELSDRHRVQLHWLAVNAQAMNVDHEPQDEFEERAVKALKEGQAFHEETSDGRYRRAAPVVLANDCLKCHLPNRTSTAARRAALSITFEVAEEPARQAGSD